MSRVGGDPATDPRAGNLRLLHEQPPGGAHQVAGDPTLHRQSSRARDHRRSASRRGLHARRRRTAPCRWCAAAAFLKIAMVSCSGCSAIRRCVRNQTQRSCPKRARPTARSLGGEMFAAVDHSHLMERRSTTMERRSIRVKCGGARFQGVRGCRRATKETPPRGVGKRRCLGYRSRESFGLVDTVPATSASSTMARSSASFPARCQ